MSSTFKVQESKAPLLIIGHLAEIWPFSDISFRTYFGCADFLFMMQKFGAFVEQISHLLQIRGTPPIFGANGGPKMSDN